MVRYELVGVDKEIIVTETCIQLTMSIEEAATLRTTLALCTNSFGVFNAVGKALEKTQV